MRFIWVRAMGLIAVAGVLAAQDAAPAAQEPAPTVQTLMRDANAKYMQREYAASIALYTQARQILEQAPATDDEATQKRYDLLKRMTTVASAMGEYPAASQLLDAAIQLRLDRYGPDDPQAIADRLHEVSVYRAMGDAAQAKTALQMVMAKHVEAGGRRNPALADDFSLMGQIAFDMQARDEAAAQWRIAIAMRAAEKGQLDVTLAPDLDRLGQVCIELRRYQEAEDTFQRALLIRESVLGTEHADLLATLDGLAYAYFGQQKWEEAEAAYKRLVALWTKSVGETHPMLAIALDKIATFYIAQHRYDEAHEAYERSTAIRKLFLATELGKEALQIAAAGDAASSNAMAHRALREMDPPNPIYDEQREAIEKDMTPEAAVPEKPAKKTTPKTAPKK
ncbi:MAG TPA: tetratricopeptide repeat protein [Bryobacteraceae bacterium]|nr:tetratricopeptide repeat protein [Bryobacteraceae bacterium]